MKITNARRLSFLNATKGELSTKLDDVGHQIDYRIAIELSDLMIEMDKHGLTPNSLFDRLRNERIGERPAVVQPQLL